ncbi:PREDICTED: transcriptional regulator ATRX homolog isoform X1 [Drosophila arizonae]|uniref:Transcriptional regulator ATRX homolog isoform X1 n=1 Tax=Drosophila arizonae TaxID=7263 RepID=A0ABM1NR26_DROAR|nr:PREDICTED: transcriptional regulator ATRX homolog isoform X1 [Drosophila arizonae]
MSIDKYIKSEITFEEEQITETSFMDLPMEQICQVEFETVLDTSGECCRSLNNNVGEMCALQKDPEPYPYIDLEFSDALNDHNYTSQEVLLAQPSLDSVKDVLLSYMIINRSTVETVPENVTAFIDNTIDKMKQFQLKNADKKADEKSSIDGFTRSNNATLSENCSEPLEVEGNDEYFESLYEHITENQSVANNVFKNTIDFVKDFYNECKSFSSKAEEDFKDYIFEKIKKLKIVANIIKTTDQSTQTFSKGLLKKRLRINYNAKKYLLDTSATSTTESECDIMDDFKENESAKDRNFLAKTFEYSDGIDLRKYINLDFNKSSFWQSCDFDNDNTNSCSSENGTDKEIERLTNLNGLKKRHVQNRGAKSNDKINQKLVGTKNATPPTEMDDDMEMYDTEHSFKESDDEIITENQYLLRFNEQVKQQLLNESNSDDSGLSDQSEYNLSKESSTEDEYNTDVVDKFLQVFESEPDNMNRDVKINEIKESKVESEKKETDSSEVCDELWNDNFIHKNKPKKSLEKLLSEAEKRNQNEEIVLSSESDYSDAEPEPVEEKTRFIKPMLRMDQLANETRAAQKSESERIRRLEKKHVMLSKAIKNKLGNSKTGDLILDYMENTKTFIKVDDDIVKQLKPHQIDGVKFMYDSCYGGIDHSKKNSGSGCILAHCMGLGKTLQLIALLHTVISYKELNTTKILVLCPKSTVMNWADELQRWLGPLKSSTHIKVFVFPDSSDISDKLRVLEEWSLSSAKRAGCLLVGYEAFRTLVFYHKYKNRGNLSSTKLESIREKVNKYLLQPGADLVVCDEGHIIKNSKSAISLAVAKIITPKRIILTGTPIQNNLKEYYSMVNFIKPLYLGTEKEFANLYANPIKNGQHKDSSKKDITVMKQRSYVLHKKLSKFVQRKEAELLKTFLPQKFEYVLFIPMTAVQNTLYEFILEAIASRGDSRGKSLITDYTVLRKIWTHPKVLEDAWKNANAQKNKKDNKKHGCPHSDDDQPDDIYDSQTGVISVTNDWWRKYLSKRDLETIMPSNKLRTMFSILRMCEEKGEKCLIFSAFVAVLNVVEYFFKKITESDTEILQHIHIPSSYKVSNTWINGQDYYRLDGKTPKNIRHEMIKRFNSEANRRARVFLISAKAGGQGINLTGANRVIILDTSWNPSNDQQNIFRIFRLGQKKNCYIYRLLAMGTMEEKVYSRSVTKQAMSFRVVDEQQIDRHYNMAELAELYTLTVPKQCERTMPVLPKDTILAHLLRQSELVYKYHEHDSLLENKVEQELSEQEKADAWDTYEKELQMNLAQQEGFNADKTQNSIHPAKLASYLGSVPSLDMQTLLSYSLQSASLMPPYSYGLNQNYIDTLSLYQKYTSLRYPDMNSCIENNFAPSPFNVLSTPGLNRLPSNPSILSHMQNLTNSKPQGRDSNLFDTQKGRSSSMNHSQFHHPIPPETTSLENSSVNSNSNNVLASLGPYKQLLENPLSGLLNYVPQGYSSSLPPENLHSNLKGGFHNFPTLLYPDKTLDEVESMSIKEKTTKSKQPVDHNIVSSVDLTSAASVPVSSSLSKTSVNSKKLQTLATSSVDNTKSTLGSDSITAVAAKNTASSLKGGMNFSSTYPSGASSSISKDYLKRNSEMQIIPTTSPPGTSSITKQLNEISPSISLTAVNSLTEKTKSRRQTLQKSSSNLTVDNKQNTNLYKSKNTLHQNISPLSNASLSAVSDATTDYKTLINRNSAELILNNSKSLTTVNNKILPESFYKSKTINTTHNTLNTSLPTNFVKQGEGSSDGRFLTSDLCSMATDVHSPGEKSSSPSRKRSTESPRENLNSKRTKL